jgi:hypothetical protein
MRTATESPYPPSPIIELQIAQARTEERLDAHDEAITEVRSIGVALQDKLDRLTIAVVAAALSFAIGSAAVVAAVMSHFHS